MIPAQVFFPLSYTCTHTIAVRVEDDMPIGPRGEKRPADLIGCAVNVARIATGEADYNRYTAPGRVRSGQAGAEGRAQALSADRRNEIAKRAAAERWR